MGRTPLQRLHDALRRRFGNNIIMTPAKNGEVGGNNRDAHRRGEITMEFHGESPEQRRRRLGKSPMREEKAQEPEMSHNPGAKRGEATKNPALQNIRYYRASNLRPRRPGGHQADMHHAAQQRTETRANTPWGLWTATGGPTYEGRRGISCEHRNNYGRKHASATRQGYQATGSYRLREEGMDTSGQVEQRTDDDLSEGTHQTYRHAISGGRANMFRSGAAMLDETCWIAYSEEGMTREGIQRDKV